jgi:hypothetical protein
MSTNPSKTVDADTHEIVVTFVHGTFASNATWVDPGSSLYVELEKRLSGRARFQTFRWSGKNTHSERLAAGESLLRQLSETISQCPRARLCIVAHSHGGNIALYALRHEEVRSRVQGVVTLATPFICTEPRNFAVAADTLLQTLALALMTVPICTVLLGFYFLVQGHGTLAMWMIWGSFAVLVGLRFLGEFGGDKVGRAVGGRVESLLEKLSIQQWKVVETLGVPPARSYPLFCVAVQGDEARRGLGFIDAVSGLPFVLFDRMGDVVSSTADFTESAAEFSSKVNQVMRPLRAFGGDGGGLIAGLGVIAAIMVAVVLIPAVVVLVALVGVLLLCAYAPLFRRLGYWGEELRAGLMAQVSVRPRPTGSPETTVLKYYDVSPTARLNPLWKFSRRLVHCNVYEDPAVISDVAAWIESGCPRPINPIREATVRRVRRIEDSGLGAIVVGILVAVALIFGIVAISI